MAAHVRFGRAKSLRAQEAAAGFCLPPCSAAARTSVEISPHHFGATHAKDAVVKPAEAWAGRTFPLKSALIPSTDPLRHHSALWSNPLLSCPVSAA
ncbi:hypothetical protein Q5P01_020841 [Channa striata]|uniref:Uncharacterized protein n=1 Tax=Channa striata TaxID=64152 RepID=A0AA88S231_CHASR|nr:hypothetical protein Q5P01_020841 [Channa striata]